MTSHDQHAHAPHGTARHGTARHGTARHGTARHGTARHGTARHGTARHDEVGNAPAVRRGGSVARTLIATALAMAVCVALLAAVACIPKDAIRKQSEAIAEFFSGREGFVALIGGLVNSMLDNYSDTLLLNIAWCMDAADPLGLALRARYVAGSTGVASDGYLQAKRLEAITLELGGLPVGGGVSYEAHVQGIGWQGARADGALAGTTGQAKRAEAVRISLTGDAAKSFSVWYRVHAQTHGWLGWAKDGADAGTTGLAKRAEAVEVQVLPKGQVPNGYDASKAACLTK